MSRTDVMASIRPQEAGTAPMRRVSSRALRRLLILPFALLVAMALAAPALAAEGTTGYNQTPSTPKTTPSTTTTTTPTSSTGTSPLKEKSEPTKATTPSTTSKAPTTTTAPAKTSTLPFTGFDLRWSVAIGLLLIGAGFSIVMVQRRNQRESGR